MNEKETLREMIKNAERIVFFGGAGVSTASGIPDFRGSAGLYTEDVGAERPEEILHTRYLSRYPERFYAYYRSHMLYPYAEPNGAHYALSQLEREGRLSAVVTQNIDGLHTAAGSRTVHELHGSVLRNFCVACGRKYPLSFILDSEGVPTCPACGAIVRPDVVLYGEGLDGAVFDAAIRAISEADLLLVGGSSLTVQPAASLIEYYDGEELVILSKTPTPYDGVATLLIRDPIEEVLSEIVAE